MLTKDLQLGFLFAEVHLNYVTIVATAGNEFWEVLEIFCYETDLGVFFNRDFAFDLAYF